MRQKKLVSQPRKKHRMRVSEKRVVRRTFEPKKEEVT
jgi:hypothetical protein